MDRVDAEAIAPLLEDEAGRLWAFPEPVPVPMRQTIRERDPIKPGPLKVNAVYPDDQPHTTMPPTLLRLLPVLPKELVYRIIGHALVLQDMKTNLIVDFIPNAIP